MRKAETDLARDSSDPPKDELNRQVGGRLSLAAQSSHDFHAVHESGAESMSICPTLGPRSTGISYEIEITDDLAADRLTDLARERTQTP